MRLCVINSVLVVCFYNHLNNLQCAYDIFLLLMFSMRLCVINSVLVVCFYNHLNNLQCAYDIFLLLMFSMRLCVINSVLVVCFYNHFKQMSDNIFTKFRGKTVRNGYKSKFCSTPQVYYAGKLASFPRF